MKTVSIKRLVLSLSLLLASVMTMPAYAWPDTDEMNMCGSAVKNVRSYASEFRGWAAHDIYIDARGLDYYFRTNCPESKATKLKTYWKPGAKMTPAKMMKRKARKHGAHKKHKDLKGHKGKYHKQKHHKHHAHDPNHKNHADCIRVDKMNNSAIFLNKAKRRIHQQKQTRVQTVDYNFYRQAQAVLNMGKANHVSKKHKHHAHNPNHKNHADCIRVDALNNSGSVIRAIRHHR